MGNSVWKISTQSHLAVCAFHENRCSETHALLMGVKGKRRKGHPVTWHYLWAQIHTSP